MTPIRAVAFDFDGTLYSNAIMYLHSLPFFLSHLRFMLAFRSVRKQLRIDHQSGDLHAQQFDLLANILSTDPSVAALYVWRLIPAWEQTLHHVPLRPGFRRLFRRLHDAGLPIALMSDFPITDKKLRLFALSVPWSCRHYSGDSGYFKPHPKPFHDLCTCLHTAPSEVLYVGNSYTYDVLGAARIGMHTAHLGRSAGTRADLTFHTANALENWLFKRLE